MKRLSGVLFVVALLALCASATYAQVFPDLVYVDVPGAPSDVYTYRVTCPANSTFPFGRLTVMAEIGHGSIYMPWDASTDTDPTTRWDFWVQDREWDLEGVPSKSNAIWEAADIADAVPANSAWTGLFVLRVPNSRKVEGIGITMGGGTWSMAPQTVYVPGPAPIPEPSSLLALGGLAGGLLPLIRRRK